MTSLERIMQAVADAQGDGEDHNKIAAELLSFAARYALAIGWGPEKVANGQRIVLAEHLADRAAEGSSRPWPDFQTKPSRCPACRRELDHATAVRHDAAPKDGDLSVCIGCGTYLVFSGAGLLVLDAEAFAALPVETQSELQRVRKAIRSLKR